VQEKQVAPLDKGRPMDTVFKVPSSIPLVVDLDGTLIKGDTLQDTFVQFALKNPLTALRTLLSLKEGRAAFKERLATHVLPDPETALLDEEVLKTIERAKEDGRKIYLATAAHQRFAEVIADSIGKFDGIFASDNVTNLKGEVKAERLVHRFGIKGFDYVGNDAADVPVWHAARTALIAGASSSLIKKLKHDLPASVVLSSRGHSAVALLRAMRPLQWLKNGLLVLPVVAGHSFDISTFVLVLIALVSFSLGASSVYLINDIIDLPHDRAHSEKRHRPIASGEITLYQSAILSLSLGAASISLALILPLLFLLTLTGYFFLAMSYSSYLKRKLMIDVVTLAVLYGIRVIAGGAATGIVLSHWLVAFCFFIFLSLALMKRAAELLSLSGTLGDALKGRNYRRADIPILHALTAAAGFVAILVLTLYINSAEVRLLYTRPDLLWGACIVLLYWLGRAFLLTGRGEMRQDPVVFAATDRVSLQAAILIGVIFLAAL
jgi:4-hydroxybenzoate polyprenyltransferase